MDPSGQTALFKSLVFSGSLEVEQGHGTLCQSPLSGACVHLLAVMSGAPDSLLTWGLFEACCVLIIRATNITSLWREAFLMVEGRN